MIRVSELIDALTRDVSKNINVLSCYISIDDRNDVIKYTIPIERRAAEESSQPIYKHVKEHDDGKSGDGE